MPARSWTLLGWVAALALLLPPPAAAGTPSTLAVAEFDYSDGSGEVRDQRAAHAERLQRFAQSLRDDLAQTGNFRIIKLDCGDRCGSDQNNLTSLTELARRQGARFLMFGMIHKQSTLIQWAKAELLDLGSDGIVFERYLTFRGDDDESWRRAEMFLAKALVATPGLPPD